MEQRTQTALLVLRLLRSEGWRSILRRAHARARLALERRSRRLLDLGDLRPGEPTPDGQAGPPVDVVVPVYGALAETRACLGSILRHTDLRRHRLFVVDDGNDQPEMRAFLAGLVEDARRQGLAVDLVRSSSNAGFTAAANLGLRASDRDVVLINSDAQVAPGWLEGLVSVAREPDTGSVTALSNRATLCTVPFAAQGPPRPDARAIEGHARLVERCSFHEAPAIPTPVGFCVLLTRRGLSAAGLFDEESFPRGYGEENDWGWRAHRKGLRHRAADSVFVYHEGGRSFEKPERRRRMRAAARLLDRRYPEHRAAVGDHLARDPLRLQRSVIEMLEGDARCSWPGVLHLTASDPSHPKGGVDHHVAELRQGLSDLGWSASVAWTEDHALRVLWGSGPEKEWSFEVPETTASERSARQAAILRYVARALDARVIHAHDTTGLERPCLLEMDAPLVLTLHDFQLFCRRPHLIDSQTLGFCGYSTDALRCGRCLAAAEESRPDARGESQESWRDDSARLIERADALVAPSRFMADAYRDLFVVRHHEHRLHVIEHGRAAQPDSLRSQKPRGIVRVVFLGQFHTIKGSRVYAAIARELSRDPRFRFAIVGGIVDHATLDEMRRSARVETVGWYERARVAGLLNPETDVVAFTSVAPESSSYTLTEALSVGLPVLAFDQGAVGERLRRIGASRFLVPCEEDSASFARRLRELADGTLAWPFGAAEPAWSRAQMAESYAALYAGLEPRSGGSAPRPHALADSTLS